MLTWCILTRMVGISHAPGVLLRDFLRTGGMLNTGDTLLLLSSSDSTTESWDKGGGDKNMVVTRVIGIGVTRRKWGIVLSET